MKIKNTYKREIERKPLNNIIFSVTLAVLIIGATTILGLIPAIKAVAQNTDYADQLTEIEIMMENKLSKIEANKQNLDQAQQGVKILNDKIPTKPNFQVFLEQMVPVTASSQFIIRQAEKDPATQNSTESVVNMVLEGDVSNLPGLINNLENEIPRFVYIDRIRTQLDEESEFDLVEIKMRIYTLE